MQNLVGKFGALFLTVKPLSYRRSVLAVFTVSKYSEPLVKSCAFAMKHWYRKREL